MTALLEVDDLGVRFEGGAEALRGVSLRLDAGQTLAILGESGAGKSTLGLCLAGLIQPPAASGSVRIAGEEVLGAPKEALRALRWSKVAVTLQGSPFNPVMTVGAQIVEPLRGRTGLSRSAARQRAAAAADEMLLDPQLLERYPHQLSGGQRSRAGLAMALILEPPLLVLDEPTQGLDGVTASELVGAVQAAARRRGLALLVITHDLGVADRLAARALILYAGMVIEEAPTAPLLVLDEPTQGLDGVTASELVGAVQAAARRRGLALVIITHDLGVADRLAARTLILYAGMVIEEAPTAPLLGAPSHPYTSALVGAFPVMTTTRDLRPIRGAPADARAIPSGCAYHPRCTQAQEICRREIPELRLWGGRLIACHLGGLRTLLEASDVWKTFHDGGRSVHALQGVSIAVREGESVGVVGPSGSGKSTLARVITGHLEPDRGTVTLEGTLQASGHHRHASRRSIQLVMQDPWEALSPRLRVAELVREPLDIDGQLPRPERDERVLRSLLAVGLPGAGPFLDSRVHELSGGQLQRVALARALIIEPKLLVADEPTSMLDPSEQARLLLALRERQVEMGLGLILVSHDIALVRKVCDRIVIIDAGRIVEEGPANLVSTSPRSVTGRRLMEAAPALAPGDPGPLDDPTDTPMHTADTASTTEGRAGG